MERYRSSIFLTLLFSLVLITACQQNGKFDKNEAPAKVKGELMPAEKKLRVFTTIAPLYSFAKNVSGDRAVVENLLSSGAGPHAYSSSPEDVMKISKAHVIVKNGIGLEGWLDKLIQLADFDDTSFGIGKQIVVDSSAGINIVDNDPHIWLSPKNAIIQVRNIRDALIKADPVNSEYYENNATDYIKRLEGLDREITELIGSLRKKDFVSLHSAFLYLAKDYGLRQVAVIQEVPEREPTPRHIATVMDAIRSNNIRVIFSETGVSSKIIETLARDLSIQVYSLDTLETGALYPEWYEERMRSNLKVLKVAMDQ